MLFFHSLHPHIQLNGSTVVDGTNLFYLIQIHWEENVFLVVLEYVRRNRMLEDLGLREGGGRNGG